MSKSNLKNHSNKKNRNNPQSEVKEGRKHKEEALGAEMLRVRANLMLKKIQFVWVMSQPQLYSFFDEYESVCNILNPHNLLHLPNTKLVKTQRKIYFGQIHNKKKHGEGISIYKDGKIFEGMYENNQKQGFGMQVYTNGNLYLGEFGQNKKHGKGTFYWFSLSQNSCVKDYDGVVEKYEGQWWGGLPDGDGEHRKANGDHYFGKFKNGLKHGEGLQYYGNGDKYKGEFVNGLPEGSGEYTWTDKSFYRGDFKQGYRNGYGVWQDLNLRQDFKGHYMLDKKHGFGIYDWGNGYIYKGQYVEDLRYGQGELYFNKDLIYSGIWLNGQRFQDQRVTLSEEKMKNSSHFQRSTATIKHDRGQQRTSKSANKRKITTNQNSYLVNFNRDPPVNVCSRQCQACQIRKKKQQKSKPKSAFRINK